MAIDKAGGVHFFGVFRDQAVDDEVIVVGAFEVDFRGSARGGMSLSDDAWNAPNCRLGLRETGEGADLV